MSAFALHSLYMLVKLLVKVLATGCAYWWCTVLHTCWIVSLLSIRRLFALSLPPFLSAYLVDVAAVLLSAMVCRLSCS
jgi:hypothetical protein